MTRGARRLDKVRPGWRGEINWADLRMGSCSRCILGQLWGTYETGADAVGVDPWGSEAYDFGFMADYGAWTELADEWERVA